ncbi:uncharacterized protein LOC142159412 [Mixophyes fleayi]|uniref:uncharacterized protein LOC142159412 n=1 Tax=Mixophyes fleayi TaxID=3061075 RepID=UPI003F4DEE06
MADCQDGADNKSSGSVVKDSKGSLKLKMNPFLYKVKECVGPLTINRMELNYVQKDHIWKFGATNLLKDNKVIMMVGETGSGKTTLINAMMNYIFGVEWQDDGRVELIVENPTMSQRSKVTIYQINHEEKFCIQNSVTIVDTNGFGDTAEEKIVQLIRELFSNSDFNYVDAICFVNQSSSTSFIPSQHMFDSILSIFAQNKPSIRESITFFHTFDDPLAPAAMTEARHMKGYENFSFNTSVLLANNCPNEANNDACIANEMQWKMGMEKIDHFFKFLSTRTRQNVTVDRDILLKTNAHEITLEGLILKIKEVISKQHELEQTATLLEQYSVDIERNEHFEFEVRQTIKQKLTTTEKSTNCGVCLSTCHRNCLVFTKMFLYFCEVFDWNAMCKVCGHSKDKHSSEKFIWQITSENRTITYFEVKEKYRKNSKKMTHKNVLEELQTEIETVEGEGLRLIVRASEYHQQLAPSNSAEDFINLLIDKEECEGKGGYQERIGILERNKMLVRRM